MSLNSKPHHQHWIPLGYIMLTVSKYFLCETPAWKHLNPKALHVCLYQNCIHRHIQALASWEEATAAGRVALWVPVQSTLSQRNTVSFWTQVFWAKNALSLHFSSPLLCLHCHHLLSESFLGFLPPAWVKSLFYILAQWPALILCCS